LKARRLSDSFRYALRGLLHTWRTQRNMRLHVIAAYLVLGLGMAMDISVPEFLFMVLAVAMVFTAEMMNTAVEGLTDLAAPDYHPLAATVKNVAAGAVLLAAIFAGAVGVSILISRVDRLPKVISTLVVPTTWGSALWLFGLAGLVLASLIVGSEPGNRKGKNDE